MRTVYREKRFDCGEYMDAYIYPVYQTGKRGTKRGKKKQESTEAQKALNQKHREQKVTRLLHANFTPRGMEIHLTYEEQPDCIEEAKRRLRNFLRRLKRYVLKHGLGELKYLGVTEGGGDGGGRFHHHVTLEIEKDIDRDELERLWTEYEGNGYANSRRLQFNEEGLEGLGRYIVKSKTHARAWTASKNLIDPQPRTRDGRVSGKQARGLAENVQDSTRFEALYPGYVLAKAETYYNDVNGGVYIFARMRKEDSAFLKPKKKEKTRKERKT